jgi:hypothetical protein
MSNRDYVPVEVPVLRLDEVEALRKHPKIRLVKMDVEGYEPDVLEGMAGLIADGRIENILCEFNSGWLKRNGATPKTLLDRFQSRGFGIVAQTLLQENLPGSDGEGYSLQDIWFSRVGSTDGPVMNA